MSHWRDPHLTERVSVILPYRLIVAPFVRDAKLFIERSGFYPPECKIVTEERQLLGLSFRDRPGYPPNGGWEVWFLGGRWPLGTIDGINKANRIYLRLRYTLGADIRHWFT